MDDNEESTTETRAEPSEKNDGAPEPAVQSEALRRQQLFVASGVAALGGIAVTVATLQQLPRVPVIAAIAGGMVTAAVLFGLLSAGIFRGTSN